MMSLYKELFVFVEGDADELFFSGIIESMFGGKYDSIEVIQWAQERRRKTDSYIKSIKSGNWNARYILVADMDTPCVTAKRTRYRKGSKTSIEIE